MKKCNNCGIEYPDTVNFCAKCGAKVASEGGPQTIVMHCKGCGGDMYITEDRKVMMCPYCGSQELIVENDSVAIERIKQQTHKEIELARQEMERDQKQKDRVVELLKIILR